MHLSSLHWSCLLLCKNKSTDRELAWAFSYPFTAISVPCIRTYTPTGDVWRSLGNKCHKYLLFKPIRFEKRGGIQLSPVALSTCLLLTYWEGLEKRSSSVAWNGAQGDKTPRLVKTQILSGEEIQERRWLTEQNCSHESHGKFGGHQEKDNVSPLICWAQLDILLATLSSEGWLFQKPGLLSQHF